MKSFFLAVLLGSLTTPVMAHSVALQDAVQKFNHSLDNWEGDELPFYQRELAKFQRQMETIQLRGERKEVILEALSYLPPSPYQADVTEAIMATRQENLTLSQMLEILNRAARYDPFGASGNTMVVAGVALLIHITKDISPTLCVDDC